MWQITFSPFRHTPTYSRSKRFCSMFPKSCSPEKGHTLVYLLLFFPGCPVSRLTLSCMLIIERSSCRVAMGASENHVSGFGGIRSLDWTGACTRGKGVTYLLFEKTYRSAMSNLRSTRRIASAGSQPRLRHVQTTLYKQSVIRVSDHW
jgi:hypothetical protein